MALADYRLCDVCEGKTFYDAELDYDMRTHPDTGFARLGSWAVVCRDCSSKFKAVVVPIEPAATKEGDTHADQE